MKPSSQSPRTPSRLSDSVHHQLSQYAIAASAAGVGVLALAKPAEAKIVYTPAHIVLNGRSNTHYDLDLNHDGIVDFVLSHTYFVSYTQGASCSGSRVLVPYRFMHYSDAVVGHSNFAYALRAGAKIGPSNNFGSSGLLALALGTRAGCPKSSYGAWANGGKGLRNRYQGQEPLRLGSRQCVEVAAQCHAHWLRLRNCSE
jgi:hypothetical protein